MPLISPQHLRAPAQRDRVARLRDWLVFARYRYIFVLGALVAEEERHGLIHFTATLPILWVLPSPSHSVLHYVLWHLVVLLLRHFCDELCVKMLPSVKSATG